MSEPARKLMLGLGVALVFAVILLWLIPATIAVPPGVQIAALSPAFWPRIVAATTVGLGLLLAVQGAISWRRQGGGARRVQRITAETRARWLHTGCGIAVLLAYRLLIEVLGIVLASILALSALALLFGERSPARLAPLAVLLPAGLYLFFTRVANIPLPLGVFG